MSLPYSHTPIIRPLCEYDAQLFIDFFQSLSKESHSFFFPHDLSPANLTELIGQIPTDHNVARFMTSVQEDGREIMAGYVFFWDWKKKVPWFGICVRDAYQGCGLGRQMMEFAIDMARQNHKGGILLSVMKTNVRAQALYKSSGFEIIGEALDGQFLMVLRFPDEESASAS
jgi:ribosomal protein S18 acetylase RimI-like enzyme